MNPLNMHKLPFQNLLGFTCILFSTFKMYGELLATAILLLMFLINREDHLHFHGGHDLSIKPEVNIVNEGCLNILEFQCLWIMDLWS